MVVLRDPNNRGSCSSYSLAYFRGSCFVLFGCPPLEAYFFFSEDYIGTGEGGSNGDLEVEGGEAMVGMHCYERRINFE